MANRFAPLGAPSVHEGYNMLSTPSPDDLEEHGLLTPELRETLAHYNAAELDLIVAMGALPRWYLQRLEALAAKGATTESVV
jgi:hypothetical protein